MTVNEISARLRARLQEEYGVDEAAILMDRPPGGWNDLVTNESLDRRLADFGARIDAKFDVVDARFDAMRHELTHAINDLELRMEREFKAQTWRLMTSTFSVMTLLVALVTIVQKI